MHIFLCLSRYQESHVHGLWYFIHKHKKKSLIRIVCLSQRFAFKIFSLVPHCSQPAFFFLSSLSQTWSHLRVVVSLLMLNHLMMVLIYLVGLRVDWQQSLTGCNGSSDYWEVARVVESCWHRGSLTHGVLKGCGFWVLKNHLGKPIMAHEVQMVSYISIFVIKLLLPCYCCQLYFLQLCGSKLWCVSVEMNGLFVKVLKHNK